MSVPPVEEPAELAVDCMQLFSRMVMGVRTMHARWSVVQIAYERMHAVIATPKPQPALGDAVSAPAVDLLVPLALDLFGSALEAADG